MPKKFIKRWMPDHEKVRGNPRLNQIFGTLNFSSTQPRANEFHGHEIEFIEMMAQNIGQALHATRLAFEHPVTHQHVEFEVPPPRDFGGGRPAGILKMAVRLPPFLRFNGSPHLESS